MSNNFIDIFMNDITATGLVEGATAPHFNLKDAQGKDFTEKSSSKIILFFYPKDSTPGCTAEACSLRDGYSELQALGFEVFGVGGGTASSHIRFADKNTLSFPLLLDEDNSVGTLYGAYGEKKFMGKTYMGIIRKTFIIENGVVTHIIDKVKTKAHYEQILEILEK